MYPSFEKIIDTLDAGKQFSFPGGVHPDDKKSLSNVSPIKTPSLPQLITLPLRQHVGSEGACCVNVGDYVYKGQVLSQATTPYSVPIHAPTSGDVVAIAPHVVAHPSGLTEMCVTIKPDGKDTWGVLTPMQDYTAHSKDSIIDALCQAGISGMGGAGFPTHIKASGSKPVEFLILNGIECEPYITSDDRLMREFAWQIRQGLDILDHLIAPKAIIIAIEDNKPEALKALDIACQDKEKYRRVSVETKYPAGGEKQLIQVLTNREVPRNGLPIDVGVLMFNVGTCYAIADAILHGKPLIERIVTVTGEAVDEPCNFKALLGTPVRHLLKEAKYNASKQDAPKVIMGGPMMGFTLADASIPVVKTTNCLLVPSASELTDGDNERACIRCSACADACPASLLPQQLFWHAKANEYDKAEDYNLFDCIECGACAYVCPSEIPLVHYYRQAKSEIRLQRDEKNKADKAKQRFEARNARLEQEKRDREEKHRKAKEARLAAANSGKSASAAASADNGTKDKVAAALARAKAKKAALNASPNLPSSDTTDDASALSDAKEKDTSGNADVPVNDKKAQVAAAIARAKAKKAANAKANQTTDTQPMPAASVSTDESRESIEDEKKAKVAAAIARAKAKKAAAADAATPLESQPNVNESDETAQDKKARIAAAVAKAKAKKAAQSTTVEESRSEDASNSQNKTNDKDAQKQARIAAAVAKAKAKKQQREVTPPKASEVEQHQVQGDSTPQDEKKARIAAAVAKAKAKKALQQKSDQS
ncbi:electron transport complex subunit RsxC [Alteromonas sp. A079]|uniref:electron transport complex subunit RsxC n=1 Tax=Alteromonas sp. A079 TaxID=3410268 RepID=UPI003BA17CE4